MFNIKALYYKAKAVRRRVTLAAVVFWFMFVLFAGGSLIAAGIAAIFWGVITWWACSQEVEKWGSIYHIGER